MYKFALIVALCTTAHAAPMLDVPLDSINQLGDLQFTTPESQQFTSSSGIPVRFTRLHGLPIVDVSVDFLVGSAYDGNQHGLAAMTIDGLTKGTKTLSENALLEKIDELGVVMNTSASKDTLSLSLRSLSDKNTLSQMLALSQEMLKNPAFDPDVLEQSKQQRITNLIQSTQDPAFVARRAFDEALYGDHPYAHLSSGSPESLRHLQAKDMQRFYREFLVKPNATITLTGDLTDSEARDFANQLSLAIQDGNKAAPIAPPKKAPFQHKHITHPSEQTVVIIGHLIEPLANDKNSLQRFANFSVANDVLAGADFNSRLMNEIRVNHGYTYGIVGRTTRLASAGNYRISFSTQSALAKDAISKTVDTITTTLQQGISQNELDLAVFNNKNGYPSHFSSNAGLHGIMQMMSVYGLPDDYLQNYPTRLDKVNLTAANRALLDTIDLKHAVVVTVGQDRPDLSAITMD